MPEHLLTGFISNQDAAFGCCDSHSVSPAPGVYRAGGWPLPLQQPRNASWRRTAWLAYAINVWFLL